MTFSFRARCWGWWKASSSIFLPGSISHLFINFWTRLSLVRINRFNFLLRPSPSMSLRFAWHLRLKILSSFAITGTIILTQILTGFGACADVGSVTQIHGVYRRSRAGGFQCWFGDLSSQVVSHIIFREAERTPVFFLQSRSWHSWSTSYWCLLTGLFCVYVWHYLVEKTCDRSEKAEDRRDKKWIKIKGGEARVEWNYGGMDVSGG
jgi:hypothetical protein